MKIKSLAVFCGSRPGNNPVYIKHAEQTGLLLARKNIRLIYGGGSVGIMGAIAGSVMNKNLFTNDLFRLGGLNSLRGFNENFFFVSQYVLGNFEFRIQGSRETYFFGFFGMK